MYLAGGKWYLPNCLLTGILGERDHSTKLEPMYLLTPQDPAQTRLLPGSLDSRDCLLVVLRPSNRHDSDLQLRCHTSALPTLHPSGVLLLSDILGPGLSTALPYCVTFLCNSPCFRRMTLICMPVLPPLPHFPVSFT